MKTTICCVVAGFACGMAWAGVSNVRIARLDEPGHVRVSYTLDAPAVVTFEARTNGVTVAGVQYATATGAVFALVQAGTASFEWMPGRDLADVPWTGETAQISVKAWATNAPPDWMVVDIAPSKDYVRAHYYEYKDQIPGSVTNLIYRKRKMILRKVPAAQVTWRQGAPSGETGGSTGTRLVTLTEDYYLGLHMLTAAQVSWLTSASTASASIKPAVDLSYSSWRGGAAADMKWPAGGHAITNTSARLYQIRAYTGMPFDLPTEAQWEFACRAGEKAALYTGEELAGTDVSDNLDAIAWYYNNWGAIYGDSTKNGYGQTFPDVGVLQPNSWGFYDMLGLAFEWCLDWWGGYGTADVTDPKGPDSNSNDRRVLRGGAMDQGASWSRCGARTYNPTTYGLYSGGKLHVKDNGTCVRNFGVRLCLPAMAYR